MAKDINGDGKLSQEELGDAFWQRSKTMDANGDGLLDSQEIAPLRTRGRRGKAQQNRPGGANIAFQVKEFEATNGQTLRYSLFVPKEKLDTPLPLVLCLHGAGGNTDAANRLATPEMQLKHPCIILAPSCDGKWTRWVDSDFRGSEKARAVLPELIETLDAVISETKADPSRIYITGQSMGGVGTWGVIANYPQKFAAAVPVCGIWPTNDALKMNGVAIWAFHGDQDEAVPVSGSREMIEALRKAGAKPEPIFTEFPGVGHGSAGPAYNMDELWEWLFSQRKSVQ